MIELILTNLAEFGIIYEDWKKTKKKYRKWAIVWKTGKKFGKYPTTWMN